jgi:ribosomal protein L1
MVLFITQAVEIQTDSSSDRHRADQPIVDSVPYPRGPRARVQLAVVVVGVVDAADAVVAQHTAVVEQDALEDDKGGGSELLPWLVLLLLMVFMTDHYQHHHRDHPPTDLFLVPPLKAMTTVVSHPDGL